MDNNDSTPTPAPEVASSSSATPAVPFRVWKPPKPGQSSVIPTNDLPESYFEPTTGEIMALQNSRTAERERLVDGPLKTRTIREREQRQREARYPITRIRVKFPDQTQLEREFPSTDKIRSVYAFVRNSLREDVKPIKFVLYQTPPRRELKVSDLKVRDQTLFQLQLAPSSILMLSFFDESMNHQGYPAPLADEILARAQDLPPPPTFDQSGGSDISEPKKQGSQVGSSTAGDKKMPKWLKLTKK